MHALLLIAHGSRRQKSNDEVRALANRLKTHSSVQYPIIHAGFLELADPLIPAGIQQCIQDGATSITVLPYFLNSGRHVVEDIPDIVSNSQKAYPDIDIRISSHLGASDVMIDLIIGLASSSTSNR
ncbi:MAG: CbiX/SirB N-terminal domain-containing protein [Gammaproteobacteria bacterium]|nr:CbiX/SirB N-terminal domain-containing protein [Gammaproteobacteria bacterium]